MIVSFIRFFWMLIQKHGIKKWSSFSDVGFFVTTIIGPCFNMFDMNKIPPYGDFAWIHQGKVFCWWFFFTWKKLGPLVKRFGKPGGKETGKVLSNRNLWDVFASHSFPNLQKKNTGGCFFVTTTRLKTTFPPNFCPPPTLLQDLMKPPNKILPNPQQFPDTQCMVHLPYI